MITQTSYRWVSERSTAEAVACKPDSAMNRKAHFVSFLWLRRPRGLCRISLENGKTIQTQQQDNRQHKQGKTCSKNNKRQQLRETKRCQTSRHAGPTRWTDALGRRLEQNSSDNSIHQIKTKNSKKQTQKHLIGEDNTNNPRKNNSLPHKVVF